MRLSEISRNDVAAAVRYVEERLDAGEDLSPDDAGVLIRLQDERAPLNEALAALYDRREAAGLSVPSFWRS